MTVDYLILGAGAAGLAAARVLSEHQAEVLLLDKGRGTGGRLATRRLGERDSPRGRWDHGAQFLTLRSRVLTERLSGWGVMASLRPWHDAENGLIRYCGADGINGFAKSLATGLRVLNSRRVVKISKMDDGCWVAETHEGERFTARKLISTIPAPQLVDLLEFSALSLPGTAALTAIQYERTLTLMLELDGPSGMETPGLLRPESGILQTVVDHQLKGISETPTLTAHALPAFSLEWYDRDREVMASVLRAAVMELLDVKVVSAQHHGWKFAHPSVRHPEPFLQVDEQFWAAGDGFQAGDAEADPACPPRVESALLSGIQVAESAITA